jgi:hypothetical protein
LNEPTIISWGRGNYSIKTKNYRFIRYFDGGEELYNHENDPDEWVNLSNDNDYTDLKSKLNKYLPKKETPMFTEHVNFWSIEGADKSTYRDNNPKSGLNKKNRKPQKK